MTDPTNRPAERPATDSRAVAVIAPALIESAVPDRELVEVEPVRTGGRRTTVRARFAAGPALVVQLSGATDAVATEAALIRAIRERTSVPVPPLVDSGVREGHGYLVSEYRDGADLHTTFTDYDAESQRAIATQFGRFLGDLHAAFAFDGCGRLRLEDGGLAPTSPDCRRWRDDYGHTAIDRLPSAFDAVRDRLVALLDDAPETATTPRLFPWDLRPGNARVADGAITALLDWEHPMAAPPALAVAKAEYLVCDWYVDEPAPLRTAFRAGYEAVRALPDVRPVHRVVAIADSAVDSHGVVTTVGYPERSHEESVAFHRGALEATLAGY